LGLKREWKERNLNGGIHVFSISPQRCEEREVKWSFFAILRSCPCLSSSWLYILNTSFLSLTLCLVGKIYGREKQVREREREIEEKEGISSVWFIKEVAKREGLTHGTHHYPNLLKSAKKLERKCCFLQFLIFALVFSLSVH
jgi:hypothetical protein